MLLEPRKQKYRKQFRGKLRGKAYRGSNLDFGEYGLKSLEGGWIPAKQIEAARRAMTRYTKRGGKIWIRIFPHKPITRKGAEVPMGSGKGSIDFYVAEILPGKVIFEMSGVSEEEAREYQKRVRGKVRGI